MKIVFFNAFKDLKVVILNLAVFEILLNRDSFTSFGRRKLAEAAGDGPQGIFIPGEDSITEPSRSAR